MEATPQTPLPNSYVSLSEYMNDRDFQKKVLHLVAGPAAWGSGDGEATFTPATNSAQAAPRP